MGGRASEHELELPLHRLANSGGQLAEGGEELRLDGVPRGLDPQVGEVVGIVL